MTDHSFSASLLSIEKAVQGLETISLGDLMHKFEARGFGFLLFFFALPAALPLPGLGINIIIALPLLYLTTQQIMGRETPWLPPKITQKHLNVPRLQKILQKGLQYITKIEHIIRPRLLWLQSALMQRILGALMLLMTLYVCIPLPLTNTVPSMGIALIALGQVSRDGLAVILGIIVGLGWIILLTGLILFLGVESLDLLKSMIKDFIL